ncbi:MAG: DUF4190 domain-containing protein [Cryomorphaceae bacterium]|nr:DUF4190 domain-containing protein [Cryomorphaceae bacterium]
MRKIILFLLVLFVGTSCEVYKKNYTGGYTFKWKTVEKKSVKPKKDKEVSTQDIASLDELAEPSKIDSESSEDFVVINSLDWMAPALESGEDFKIAKKPSNHVNTIEAEQDFLKALDVLSPTLSFYESVASPPDIVAPTVPKATTGVYWASLVGFISSLLGLILMFTPLGLIGIVLVIAGLVLSIVGLRSGEPGEGFAIAGIIISSVALLLLLIAIIFLAAFIATL